MNYAPKHAGGERYLRFIALLLLLGALSSCKAFIAERPYQATPLPADVTELFRVFGDTGSDTVWIYEQGGPVHVLEEDPLQQFRHYPGHDAVQFVQVHQTLTIDHDLAARHRELSLAELQAEVDVSVEILHRTIAHFKAQGKQVVVVGHSYGAFLTTRYLWRKGAAAADRYLIMAGRLDMPRVVVDGVLDGEFYYFPNAVDPAPFPVPPLPIEFLPPTTERELLQLRIMGATGHDRYTQRLAGTDLSRVLYVYGSEDMIVGRLTADEVSFLTSQGSRVIAVPGGHTSMFEDSEVAAQIAAALERMSRRGAAAAGNPRSVDRRQALDAYARPDSRNVQ